MLADAKILMTSAPSAFRCRTCARSVSGVGRWLLNGLSEVNTRGPGIWPRAIHSRRSLSSGEPGLWIVVKPAINVAYAFPAVDNIDWTGVSLSVPREWYRPSRLKYQVRCECASIIP